MRPSQQIYSSYTAEDFNVWNILYQRQLKILSEHVSKAYLDGLKAVEFSASAIPDFVIINQRLIRATGWGLKVVPNLCPQKEFFESISLKRFTSTCWLRTMEQLDYIEEPDMFHDVFGHVPLLSNPDYCLFLEGLSKIALEHIAEPDAIELLGKLYWFTIEFGLIKEAGNIKIYGAGIISSPGETINSLNTLIPKIDFNLEDILNSDYRTGAMQEKYYMIDSFEQLYNSLPKLKAYLVKKFKEPVKEKRYAMQTLQ